MWLGAGETQGILGLEAPDNEAEETEDKVTPLDGDDVTQTYW